MGTGRQSLPRLDRVTGTKGTDITERLYWFESHSLSEEPANPPTSCSLSLFRKPLQSNKHTQDPALLPGTAQADENQSLLPGR